ncbi:MAG: DNA/RNA nuclease SfsA [Clostridia bacterium]|nr:DNA/RNA nuclease SfsA [Clostridia bacterium]
MMYENTCTGVFESRPNRFIAKVWVENTLETVHVKNTGRCKELLLPGAEVTLQRSDDPKRKTKFDLISVYKPGLGWVNIDSQAPNKVAAEWLRSQNFDVIRPEYTFGGSRVDFYMERGEERWLLEVKGCTLEIDGVGYFPDAPTLRGVKHLEELARAAQNGWHCAVAFVIPMPGVEEVQPNTQTHPEFAVALRAAREAGVRVLFLPCEVTENTLQCARSCPQLQ